MGKFSIGIPLQLSDLLSSFRESSKKLVVGISSKNSALNLSGALLLIGLGYSLKWWYNDQLLTVLFKNNLPALSEPQQKISRETGEYLLADDQLKEKEGLTCYGISSLGETDGNNSNSEMACGNNAQFFDHLIERIDLYANSVVIKLESPWEKHAYHRFVGVFPEKGNQHISSFKRNPINQSALGANFSVIDNVHRYIHKNAKTMGSDFAKETNNAHDLFVSRERITNAGVMDAIDVGVNSPYKECQATLAANVERMWSCAPTTTSQDKPVDCKKAERIDRVEEGDRVNPLPLHGKGENQQKLTGKKVDGQKYAFWGPMYPESWFRLSARGLCVDPYDTLENLSGEMGDSCFSPKSGYYSLPFWGKLKKFTPSFATHHHVLECSLLSRLQKSSTEVDMPKDSYFLATTRSSAINNDFIDFNNRPKGFIDRRADRGVDRGAINGFVNSVLPRVDKDRKALEHIDSLTNWLAPISIGELPSRIDKPTWNATDSETSQIGVDKVNAEKKTSGTSRGGSGVEKLSYPLELTTAMVGWQPPINTLILNSYLDEIPYKLETYLPLLSGERKNQLQDDHQAAQAANCNSHKNLVEIKKVLTNELSHLADSLAINLIGKPIKSPSTSHQPLAPSQGMSTELNGEPGVSSSVKAMNCASRDRETTVKLAVPTDITIDSSTKKPSELLSFQRTIGSEQKEPDRNQISFDTDSPLLTRRGRGSTSGKLVDTDKLLNRLRAKRTKEIELNSAGAGVSDAIDVNGVEWDGDHKVAQQGDKVTKKVSRNKLLTKSLGLEESKKSLDPLSLLGNLHITFNNLCTLNTPSLLLPFSEDAFLVSTGNVYGVYKAPVFRFPEGLATTYEQPEGGIGAKPNAKTGETTLADIDHINTVDKNISFSDTRSRLMSGYVYPDMKSNFLESNLYRWLSSHSVQKEIHSNPCTKSKSTPADSYGAATQAFATNVAVDRSALLAMYTQYTKHQPEGRRDSIPHSMQSGKQVERTQVADRKRPHPLWRGDPHGIDSRISPVENMYLCNKNLFKKMSRVFDKACLMDLHIPIASTISHQQSRLLTSPRQLMPTELKGASLSTPHLYSSSGGRGMYPSDTQEQQNLEDGVSIRIKEYEGSRPTGAVQQIASPANLVRPTIALKKADSNAHRHNRKVDYRFAYFPGFTEPNQFFQHLTQENTTSFPLKTDTRGAADVNKVDINSIALEPPAPLTRYGKPEGSSASVGRERLKVTPKKLNSFVDCNLRKTAYQGIVVPRDQSTKDFQLQNNSDASLTAYVKPEGFFALTDNIDCKDSVNSVNNSISVNGDVYSCGAHLERMWNVVVGMSWSEAPQELTKQPHIRSKIFQPTNQNKERSDNLVHLVKNALEQSSSWATHFLGPENPLTDRQSHFFGQRRLDTMATRGYQRDYLRYLAKEALAQSTPKGSTARTSIERLKILSFSRSLHSLPLKKRKYAYLLEKNDEWHLLFQEQFRAALEDPKKYPPLTPEEQSSLAKSTSLLKEGGSGRIKVAAPLATVRFPAKRSLEQCFTEIDKWNPLINSKSDVNSLNNSYAIGLAIDHPRVSPMQSAQPGADSIGALYTEYTLPDGVAVSPPLSERTLLRSPSTDVPSTLSTGLAPLLLASHHPEGLATTYEQPLAHPWLGAESQRSQLAKELKKTSIISHYPLPTETMLTELNGLLWFNGETTSVPIWCEALRTNTIGAKPGFVNPLFGEAQEGIHKDSKDNRLESTRSRRVTDGMVDKSSSCAPATASQARRVQDAYTCWLRTTPKGLLLRTSSPKGALLNRATQEPLTSHSWQIIIQWSLLVALLFWVEQILLEGVFPALSALEHLLLGAIDMKSSDRTRVIRVIKGDVNTPKFQDIAGVDGLLGELSELVLFLRGHKEQLWNRQNSQGVLLTGPPGTGKTFLVRALAGEAKVPVLILSAGALAASKGNSNKPSWSIRHAFRIAGQLAPCILFIDELDALGQSRGEVVTDINEIVANISNQNGAPLPLASRTEASRTESAQQGVSNDTSSSGFAHRGFARAARNSHATLRGENRNSGGGKDRENTLRPTKKQGTRSKFGPLTQLLVSMDGVNNLSGVLVLGATNRPESLDPALTRPGRFERVIRVEKPAEEKRIEILKLYSRKLGVQHQIPWSYLANRTVGLTAADLAVAMNYSSLKAILQGSMHTVETIEYGLDSIVRFDHKGTPSPLTPSTLAPMQSTDLQAMSLSTGSAPVLRLLRKTEGLATTYDQPEGRIGAKPNGKTNEQIASTQYGKSEGSSVFLPLTENVSSTAVSATTYELPKRNSIDNTINVNSPLGRLVRSSKPFGVVRSQQEGVDINSKRLKNKLIERLLQIAYYQAGKIVIQTLLPLHPPVALVRMDLSGITAATSADTYIPVDNASTAHSLESRLVGLYGGKAASLLILSSFISGKKNISARRGTASSSAIPFSLSSLHVSLSELPSNSPYYQQKLKSTKVFRSPINRYVNSCGVLSASPITKKLVNKSTLPTPPTVPLVGLKPGTSLRSSSSLVGASLQSAQQIAFHMRSTFPPHPLTSGTIHRKTMELTPTGQSDLGSQELEIATRLADRMVEKWGFYSWEKQHFDSESTADRCFRLPLASHHRGGESPGLPFVNPLSVHAPICAPSDDAWVAEKLLLDSAFSNFALFKGIINGVNGKKHFSRSLSTSMQSTKLMALSTSSSASSKGGLMMLAAASQARGASPIVKTTIIPNVSQLIDLLHLSTAQRDRLYPSWFRLYLPDMEATELMKNAADYYLNGTLKLQDILHPVMHDTSVMSINGVYALPKLVDKKNMLELSSTGSTGACETTNAISSFVLERMWNVNTVDKVCGATLQSTNQNKDINCKSFLEERSSLFSKKDLFSPSCNRLENSESQGQTFSIDCNDFSMIEKEFFYHSLVTNCFTKALLLADQNRQLLDYFADYLLRFKIIRQDRILYIFSTLLLNRNRGVS